ncbi:putative Rieske [2Fe-2S] domain-containing cell death suppressor protein [Crocosphaera subtropica ATCC 51142]|uniref:Rieske [2Fe-2S] domain-containing cell death suppressor protein n=1 Tax=Crocosphaera subtropica (strain ATCC 51142 / BH68) TaxID=43989 RepID=B1WVI1_CROS5|nr:Rieske 2Fe-2S domain-containing protein [Crocosphaera subtropica]ACB53971.1 putative Rieske [2Fe-2S] domain-containing cell death suppressor protein [Crocosphaera subtropica ATCC 51142]
MISQFSWSQNWYPISPLSYLDPSVPTPITILGKKLVIWQTKNQQWVVMDDQCPHKLAQLSFGKIQADGTLMCRHHGWCFNEQGNCTKIPMLVEEEAIKTACNSSRSQVTVYPTQVKQGLLWVWPDNQETAFEDCQLKEPAIIPECGLDVTATDWHLSEVPVGYTVSLESSFDPSHAQFLHEGLAGFSPEKTIPITSFKTVSEISAEAGFTLKHSGYNIFNQDMEATRQFSPPCCNTTIYRYPNGNMMLAQLYFIPTEPGRCRYIGKFITSMNFSQKNIILDRLPKQLRTGFKHLSNYQLSDQDLTVMHAQETLQMTVEKPWHKSYFLPASADVGIITFRQWLDRFAGGKPAWENAKAHPYQPLTEEQLYERWHRHTKYCPSCRASVDFLGKLQQYSRYSMIIFSVFTLLLLVIPVSIKLSIVSTILAVISVFVSLISDDFRYKFISGLPKQGLPVRKLYDN